MRKVFFIDSKGVIRTIIYYPLSLGRNFDELYRDHVALQNADEFNVATPADLRPGDDVIAPPASSCRTAKDRMEGKEEMYCYDWFFCTKPIAKEKVLKKCCIKTEILTPTSINSRNLKSCGLFIFIVIFAFYYFIFP